jgi:hypothetical protein
VSFVITCRAWKALFKEKEKKKNLLNWKDRSKEKRSETGHSRLI